MNATTTFEGKDWFGNPVFASRGNTGSIIIIKKPKHYADEDDEDADADNILSLDPESAFAFSKWIGETNVEKS